LINKYVYNRKSDHLQYQYEGEKDFFLNEVSMAAALKDREAQNLKN